ncbi:MAG: hypothetical protein ACRD2L_14540 [Terriglobia bacterium]
MFNLETTVGWYLAGVMMPLNGDVAKGIVVRNCTNNYYGGELAQVRRELRNPKRGAPATVAPRPKPPTPRPGPKWQNREFRELQKDFYLVNTEAAFGQEFYKWWEDTVKIAPTEFFSRLLDGVSVSKEGSLTLKFNRGEFHYSYRNVQEGISFQRAISGSVAGGNLQVEHDLFTLRETAQSSGIGKRLLGNSMKLYQEMGVSEIVTLANISVGGYAWAKYGFYPSGPTAWQTLIDNIEDRLPLLSAQNSKISKAVADFLDKNRNNPQAVWELSDMDQKVPGRFAGEIQKLGKRLLLKQSWPAVLELDNKEAMARFNAYVYGQKK